MAIQGRSQTAYLSWPPAWVDSIIRPSIEGRNGVRVRLHAGPFSLGPEADTVLKQIGEE
jgi:hypothetical protein